MILLYRFDKQMSKCSLAAYWLTLRPRINLERCKERQAVVGRYVQDRIIWFRRSRWSVMGDRSLHSVHRNDLASFGLRSHSSLFTCFSICESLSFSQRCNQTATFGRGEIGGEIIFLLYDIPYQPCYHKNTMQNISKLSSSYLIRCNCVKLLEEK